MLHLKKPNSTKNNRNPALLRFVFARINLVGHLGRRDTDAVGVAVEQHTLVFALGTHAGFNPLARASASPEGLEESSPPSVGLGAVVSAHHFLDGFARFVGVVEGNGANIVVQDVGFDNSVEDVTADESKVAVNGGSGSTSKVPGFWLVVGEGGVGVLEVSDGHYNQRGQFLTSSSFLTSRELTEPVVHPEIRKTIPDQQVLPPIVGTDKVQNRTHNKKTEITQNNELGVLSLVQRARGVEMVHTTKVTICLALSSALRLVLVVVVTSDVGEEIHGPPEKLLQENGGGRENRGLLHQFTQFVDRLANARSIFVTGLGDEDHITSDVAGGLVVLSVGDLPGEVGDKQGGMANPANGVVQSLGG